LTGRQGGWGEIIVQTSLFRLTDISSFEAGEPTAVREDSGMEDLGSSGLTGYKGFQSDEFQNFSRL
jgi:hypothetical protein